MRTLSLLMKTGKLRNPVFLSRKSECFDSVVFKTIVFLVLEEAIASAPT